MRLEHIADIIEFDPFETRTEADAVMELGQQVRLADMRSFRHGVAGGSNISVGKLQQAAAPIAHHANMACGVAAIGATAVTVTPAGTAGAGNLYSEGYLCINDVTGQGQTFKVKDHLALTASTAFIVNLFDPIKVALDATSEATLVHSGYKNVIEVATSLHRPAGVPLISILTGDYGWLQTKGVASVLCGTARTLGSLCISSGATAGAVVDATDVLGASGERIVGECDIIAGVGTEYNPMTLKID